MSSVRLEQLKRYLKARTDADDKPLPGFAETVKAIRAEIARLEGKPL